MSTNINERLYLFDRLDTGNFLHIIFMSHNAYWANALILSERYKNCKIEVFGRGTAYLEMAKYSEYYEPIDNCDLIILRETEYKEFEFNKMQEIAREISKEKNKPVTILYSYLNPNYKSNRIDGKYKIKLNRINSEDELESSIIISDPHPLNLINIALIIHDNKEKQLVNKKRTNK